MPYSCKETSGLSPHKSHHRRCGSSDKKPLVTESLSIKTKASRKENSRNPTSSLRCPLVLPPPTKPTPPPPRRVPADDGSWASALVLPTLAAATSSFIVSSAALTISLSSPRAPHVTPPQPTLITSRARSPKHLAVAARLGHTSHAPFLAQLRSRGYIGYAAKPGGLTVLYCNPAIVHPDQPLSSLRPSRTSLIMSGTFTAVDYLQSVGPIIRNGILDTEGVPKAVGRGGIAIYDDGTFAIGRSKGGELLAIQEAYYRPGRSVNSFMGGGRAIAPKS